MKNKLIVIYIALIIVSALSIYSLVKAETIPVINDNSILYFEAKFDGKKLNAMLDTGSAVTLLSSQDELYLRLCGVNLKKSKDLNVTLADGTDRTVPTAIIKNIVIGHKEYKNITVVLAGGESTIIGQNILSKLKSYTVIDSKNLVIE